MSSNIYILNIGSSDTNTKIVTLPDNIDLLNCKFTLHENKYPDTFNFIVYGNSLMVTRTDLITGWGYDHNVYISSIVPSSIVPNSIVPSSIITNHIVDCIPKVIYMTYKSTPPEYVFNNWKKLNPNYTIDFSLDEDCIQFLKKNFTEEIVDMFINIKEGMYKADLWRLCKLYINGGVYADIDLVPYVSIDDLIKDTYTFYSCLAVDKKSIFQAFIITEPQNPLILQFIISFINNKPYYKINGPTYDMYDNIKSLVNTAIHSETLYKINMVHIPVLIGSSDNNIKVIETFFKIPINAVVNINDHEFDDTFNISFSDNTLSVQRTDKMTGWGYNHSVNISIPTNQSIMLFTEKMDSNRLEDAYVSYKNSKIFNSRYVEYLNAKQKNKMWN